MGQSTRSDHDLAAPSGFTRQKRDSHIMRNFKLVFVLLLLAGSSWAGNKKEPTPEEKAAECLACHSDANLIKEENGKQISLHVDEQHFKSSIHGSRLTTSACTQSPARTAILALRPAWIVTATFTKCCPRPIRIRA
jgi:hypothetical protein